VLKRPSSRRNSHQEQIELNLVPILDTMVTLIGFLLFTTSFLSLVSIESQLPQSSPSEVQQQMKDKQKPLQLTLSMRPSDVEIWSPFEKITPKAIPNTKEGMPDAKAIHEALLEIKKKFPTETSVVVIPIKTAPYDVLISLMDAARTLEKTDTTIFIKNEKTGLDEPIKALFPKVVFGNLLGDG
jgi:biopolymer transport protein ExbD